MAQIFKEKLYPPPSPQVDLSSQTVIVTGSNSGLGFEAAVKYVQLGASTVVLAVRSLERGERARAAIEERTGRTGVVKVMLLDMNDYPSILSFVERVDKEISRVDIVVLNAGVLKKDRHVNEDGWEDTIFINAIQTTLLGILLLPKLKASRTETSTPHLAIVASTMHRTVQLSPEQKQAPLKTLNGDQEAFDFRQQYGRSKLLLMYATRRLAKMATDANGEPEVFVNDLCPGFCTSDLTRDHLTTWWARMLIGTAESLISKSTEAGARTLVIATTLGKESHGKFILVDHIEEPNPLLVGDEGKQLQDVVWGELIETLKPKVPSVGQYA